MPSRGRYVVKKWQNIVIVVCERPLVYLELTNKSNPSQVQFTLTKEKLTFCQMVTTPSGFSEGWTSHQPAHLSILEKHVNIYFILKRSVSFVNLFSRVCSLEAEAVKKYPHWHFSVFSKHLGRDADARNYGFNFHIYPEKCYF